jgi:ABC-type transport system involved in multi-copper enzyme maturation permease subunit
MQIKNLKNQKKEKAFISIFAIFFSAIIVSVLIALFVLLIKQIQLLSIDSSSFQAFYTADSAVECAIAQEKTAAERAFQTSATTTPTFVWDTTVFRSENWSNFQGCAAIGDIDKPDAPTISSSRSTSKFNLKINVGEGVDFCGLVTVNRNLSDASTTNNISVFGRSANCNDISSARVVEREVQVEY